MNNIVDTLAQLHADTAPAALLVQLGDLQHRNTTVTEYPEHNRPGHHHLDTDILHLGHVLPKLDECVVELDHFGLQIFEFGATESGGGLHAEQVVRGGLLVAVLVNAEQALQGGGVGAVELAGHPGCILQ